MRKRWNRRIDRDHGKVGTYRVEALSIIDTLRSKLPASYEKELFGSSTVPAAMRHFYWQFELC